MAFHHRASRATSRLRAVGGRLSVEDARLVFRPLAFDRLLRAREWSVPLAAIAGTGVAPARLPEMFAGGSRPRLEVQLRDGGTERFVVSDPERRARELAALLP